MLAYVKSLHDREFPINEKLREIIRHSSDVFSEEFRIQEGGDILERVTFNPGVIAGGEKVNIVAQHCTFDLELRIPWGCSIQDLVRDIREHAPHGTILQETAHDPSFTDPNCDFVGVVCREVERVWGGNVFPILQWAASDARHPQECGIQGDLSTARENFQHFMG